MYGKLLSWDFLISVIKACDPLEIGGQEQLNLALSGFLTLNPNSKPNPYYY
jgi:hypothetical protein